MRKFLLILCMLSVPATALAWPWSRDLMNQPSIKPQEGVLLNPPANTVPVDGLWTKMEDRDATEELANPIKVSQASLMKGKALFNIFCATCHGSTGTGNGEVGKAFELEPADLTSDYVKELTDGWLWGTITFGSYVMPRYGYDMNPEERWDVVNYIREVIQKPMTAMNKEDRKSQVMHETQQMGGH